MRTDMYLFIGLGGQELLFLIGAVIMLGLFLALPLVALIDIIRSEFKGTNDKLIWVIIVLFFNIIGALLYFFMGRNQRIA